MDRDILDSKEGGTGCGMYNMSRMLRIGNLRCLLGSSTFFTVTSPQTQQWICLSGRLIVLFLTSS